MVGADAVAAAAAALAAAALATRSNRRAHRGGRFVAGKTQGILARRQFEHGDCLSQRTLRLRHTTQLRSLGAAEDADVVGAGADAGADGSLSELLLLLSVPTGWPAGMDDIACICEGESVQIVELDAITLIASRRCSAPCLLICLLLCVEVEFQVDRD